MKFTTKQIGSRYSNSYRVYIERDGHIISPFHDIPLKQGTLFNYINEIPKFSNAKCEIATGEAFNPIKQDVKKGALRFVKNVFPYHGYPWNYGAFPQTWESPLKLDHHTGLKGDNDPLDAIEIGEAILKPGQVVQVKVLGVVCLLDEGETDWKMITINVEDPLAEKLNDIDDIKTYCPGFIEATVNWFKVYKIPDGKTANTFAFNGEAQDNAFALKIIEEMHEQWKELVSGKTSSNLAIQRASANDVPPTLGNASSDELPLENSVHKWHFVQ